MVCQVLFVVGQRGISGEIGRQVGVTAQELAKAGQFSTIAFVAVAGTQLIAIALLVLIAIFIPHEGDGVRAKLVGDVGMRLQIPLQSRVIRDPLPVVDQRRIPSKLLGNFRMTIQEMAHVGYFVASYAITALFPSNAILI